MKKIRFAVISVIVVLSIAIALSVLHITNKNRTQDVFEGTDICVGVDEYIKAQKKEKAPDGYFSFLVEVTGLPYAAAKALHTTPCRPKCYAFRYPTTGSELKTVHRTVFLRSDLHRFSSCTNLYA